MMTEARPGSRTRGPGRRRTMKGAELDEYELPGVPRYLSLKEFAELLGVTSKDVKRVLDQDYGLNVPDPDIVGEPIYARDLEEVKAAIAEGRDPGVAPDRIVGGKRGWLRDRAIAWGIEIGRLNEDGTVREGARSWRVKGGPLAHWRKKPVVFLTQVEAARFLGFSDGVGVYQLRQRGTFVKPAAAIGDTRVWDKPDIVRWAAQTGRTIPDHGADT